MGGDDSWAISQAEKALLSVSGQDIAACAWAAALIKAVQNEPGAPLRATQSCLFSPLTCLWGFDICQVQGAQQVPRHAGHRCGGRV